MYTRSRVEERNLRILYIEHYAGSISTEMEFRPFFCERVDKVGHEVRIIAADYPHLRVRNPVPQKGYKLGKIDRFHFQWVHINLGDMLHAPK